jgi:nitrogen fixation-related uncharacterized protein
MILLKFWIAYAIWGTGVYSAVFIWAVRNKQFSEPDRQRRMALDTEDPVAAWEEHKKRLKFEAYCAADCIREQSIRRASHGVKKCPGGGC